MGRVAAGVCGARGLGHRPAGDGGAAGWQAVFSACPQLHFPSATRTAALVVRRAAPVGADVEQVRPLHPASGAAARAGGTAATCSRSSSDAARELVQAHGRGRPAHDPVPARGRVLVPPEAGALCCVYDAIPGCAAAACSLAEQPPERLRFVPPREICT
ncbi:MAG: hypothetical protein ACLSHG_09995 [Oscillospiraceae bacterium]